MGHSTEGIKGPTLHAPQEKQGLVESALVLSTVNHPYFKDGKNLNVGPGSQVWDSDWTETLRHKLGINAYAHYGSKLDPQKFPEQPYKKTVMFETPDRSKGVPFKVPLFTMGLRFSEMTAEEVKQYVKAMLASSLQFIHDIESKEQKPLGLIQSAHLFLNAYMAGEINVRRAAANLPYIPTVATAHGTALKFYKKEKWFQTLTEPETFGNPFRPQPHNLCIGPEAFDALKSEYGNLFELQSRYSEKLGISALEFLGELKSPTLMGFHQWIAPYIYRGVGSIVAISEANRDNVMNIFPDYPTDHISVIYNGYNGDIFVPMNLNKKAVLTELRTSTGEGLPQHIIDADRVVVMVGKFVNWKGVDKLIMAAAGENPSAAKGIKHFKGYEGSFAAQGETVATIIMGTNKDEPELVKEYESLPGKIGAKNVVFLGHVTPEIVAKVNAIADVGVYPSKKEPFGMVAMEAMAGGLPVLVGTGGFRNFVDEAKGGYVDPDRPETIAEQVRTALSENWKVSKGPVALDYATKHTWVDQFKKYMEVYQEVADWVQNGHPKDVHHPRRLTYTKANGGGHPLTQATWSPYKVAMELVKLVPSEYAKDAAKAAVYVKCALRHGWNPVTFEEAKGQIKEGSYQKILDRIEAAKK